MAEDEVMGCKMESSFYLFTTPKKFDILNLKAS